MEDTKQRILEKSLELFSTKGYDAVSVGEIAKAVGIKAPSLYNHFPSKQAIFDAILETTSAHYQKDTAEIAVHVQDSQKDIPVFSHISEELLVEKVRSGKMSMHVHTLLMAQLRQLKSKDSLLHLAFSGIRNPCFLLLHVCGNCFRFSSGRCFPEQTKSLLSGCRLCCLRSLQNICILCSQTFIILSNYKHTFFTRYEYTNNCQKEINLFT